MEKLLQDYLTFIQYLGDFGSLDVSVLKARFKHNIHPLITIASNNGFDYYRGRSGVNKILFFRALLLIFKTIIMGHNICALIGKAPINEVKVNEYGLAVAYESGYAIIFLDVEHIDHWSGKLNLSCDSRTDNIDWDCELTVFWAKELGLSMFAIIQTNYFAGMGYQSACVYESEKKLLNKIYIHDALIELGVPDSPDSDAFDTLNLSGYRHTEQYYWNEHNQAVGRENMIPGKL